MHRVRTRLGEPDGTGELVVTFVGPLCVSVVAGTNTERFKDSETEERLRY